MNNNNTIPDLKKTGLTACLFLCSLFCYGQEKQWLADEKLNRAYTLVLNLQVDEARTLLNEIKTPEQIYVASLADALELLVSEDEGKFDIYEVEYEKRLDQLERIEPLTADALFALAELRLQWAFTYLKFSHEFDAAWNIRQAYLAVQECKKKSPGFIPIKKSSGLLEIMLGSVPEKYQWVMNVLNMEGSIETGLQDLQYVMNNCPRLSLETALLANLFRGFILQQTESASAGFDEIVRQHPAQNLVLFLGASVAIKNSQSEKALTYLTRLKDGNAGLRIPYLFYQLGEVYLHKGEYESSIRSFQKFLDNYSGQNYIKDSYYKTGICYWLSENPSKAAKYFNRAKEEGRESSEADKYAARNLIEGYPNVKLSKIRYATDGGYYDQARKIASSVTERELSTPKEKIEFTYRKARLAHKSGSVADAKKDYLETIHKQGDENWYYAPNACLQLGYLLMELQQHTEAKEYFEKALTYKKHEYKNSIDSKAKSALTQLKEHGE